MLNQNDDHVAERAELEAVLSSGIFQRAPSLGQFLTFVCEKRFAGEPQLIREYHVAVEALGRGPNFNQKTDSIVRVEAHRLRKRLREYYESEGANHTLRITLPAGGYSPAFERVSMPKESLAEADTLAETKTGRNWLRWWPMAAIGAFVVVALSAALWLQGRG